MPEQINNHHKLKIDPEHFRNIVSGLKKFEIRKNDRSFQVDDLITLCEYDRDKKEYSGKEFKTKITSILYSHQFEGLRGGYCIFSIAQDEILFDRNHALKSKVCQSIDDKIQTLKTIGITTPDCIELTLTMGEDFDNIKFNNNLVITPYLIFTNDKKFLDNGE